MKGFVLPVLVFAVFVVASRQAVVPAVLSGHVHALQEAGALRMTLAVQPTGGPPSELRISFGRPNLYRLDSQTGFVLSDGKTVYTYDKASNTYTETPADAPALAKHAMSEEAWAWGAFFSKEALRGVRSAQSGSKRNLKGNPVTEIAIALDEGSATIYLDSKLGIARGFALKRGKTDLLVLAKEIEIGKDVPAAGAFQFSAPSGATKAVAPARPLASYAMVQSIFNRSCMPCHGGQMRSGGLDLSSYAGVTGKPGVVVPREPDASRLVQHVRGTRQPRMPQGRGPLSNDQIELLAGWISDGASRD